MDCNVLNPGPERRVRGDLRAANLNFGQPLITSPVGEDILNGWGVVRPTTSSGSTCNRSCSHGSRPTVGYNRRWWKNYTSVDNINTTPPDYEKVTIAAP